MTTPKPPAALPSTLRPWVWAIVTFAICGLSLCTSLACAAQFWLPTATGPLSYTVIFCIHTLPGHIYLDYRNPIISEAIVKPGLNPPCVITPWSSSLPQGGSLTFP